MHKIKLGILFYHPVLYSAFDIYDKKHSLNYPRWKCPSFFFPFLFFIPTPFLIIHKYFALSFEIFLGSVSSFLCYLSCQEYCHSSCSHCGLCLLFRVQTRPSSHEDWPSYSSPQYIMVSHLLVCTSFIITPLGCKHL